MLSRIFAIALLVAAILVTNTGCLPQYQKISFVSDSMGYYDQAVIKAEIEADGGDVVSYLATPYTTVWNNPNLVAQIKSPNNNIVVVTFGINEASALGWDGDRPASKTIQQVAAEWQAKKDLATQYGKCLVWVTTQNASPLNHSPLLERLQALNWWIRLNTVPAEWQPTVDYNINNHGATWVNQADGGFHPKAGTWGPHAYGIKIREAINSGC